MRLLIHSMLQGADYGSGARLVLLVLVLVLLQPAPILIVSGARQEVETTHPILGVHTRLTDEVEPWKIQRTLQMVRELGASSIVEFFPWAYYHAEDGGVAWEHPDLVINHANAQGLDVIARLGLTPSWARPPDTPLNYLDAAAYDDFASFAAAFAERYEGQVTHIIVWNEPNLSFEWGYRKTSPQEYVELLKVVYAAIKEASPDTQVLAGALAPNLEPADSPWAYNDLDYLAGIYESGGGDYFDGLAVHVYGLTFPALSEPDESVLNFRRVELMREVMLAQGDDAKPMYITETGWNDHPRWTLAVKPAQRIKYTIDAIEYAEQNWPYVEALAIWAFRFPAPSKSYMDYYTLVTPEFVAKPIYDALKEFTSN
ncbi:MAG: cellulase family glycosylhydrolase [Chloroflexota bacterium]|nr:MAG: cellulase family glycosylhydrolase [Chloroflexota bacterium]